MIIKTFAAETSAAALKQVREELGGEAFVLKTRAVTGSDGSAMMEVTACLEDRATAPQKSKPNVGDRANGQVVVPKPVSKRIESIGAVTPDNSLNERIDRLEQKLDLLLTNQMTTKRTTSSSSSLNEIRAALNDADAPLDFADSLISELKSEDGSSDKLGWKARTKLVEKLSAIMAPAITFKQGDTILFVGSAGAGKSSVMGKLAARLITEEKQKVKLVSLDDVKIGALDEICNYAELLGAETADALSLTSDTGDPQMITLVDAPALSNDSKRLDQLIARVKSLNPTHTIAVFSALTRTDDISDLAARLNELKPTSIAITMTDLTPRLGAAIGAAEATGCKISFICDSPGGIGRLGTPDPDSMARKILKMEVPSV